jgi:hypothetical protein
MWDYVIVGGGPSGLSLAWYFARYNKKILLIDKNSSLGGCHRVMRVDGLFAEHGPRIYINNYKMLIAILHDMGYSFEDFFTEYKFSMFSISTQSAGKINYKEIGWFVYEFVRFLFNKDYSRKITMRQFMSDHNFSQTTQQYIDKLCRLTDGAGIDRYTLYEFLQIINQHMFYNIYQPKLPNDVGLIKYWEEALKKTGNVDIFLDTEVIDLNIKENLISTMTINKNNKQLNIKGKNYILAIPPKQLIQLLSKSTNDMIKDAFGNYNKLLKWSVASEYLRYMPITFHWDKKLKLKEVWGLPSTEWGVSFIILSDYMNFNDPRSKTVITTCVTLPDVVSSKINKTANQCSKEELIGEVLRQLKVRLRDLPDPMHSILSPEMYQQDNKWYSSDSAFVYTPAGYGPLISDKFTNLFSVGTHNGNSKYAFTSMEAAIENSAALLHLLIPQSKERYPILQPVSLEFVIDIIIVLVLFFILYKMV